MSSSSTVGSRHLSWLVKSCFPNPHQTHNPIAAAASATTIASLPDDLLLECLARVSPPTLFALPSVCPRWAHLINSTAFHSFRRRHHLLLHTLFAISISDNFTLLTAALRLDQDGTGDQWKLSSFVPSKEIDGGVGLDFALYSHPRLASVGRRIYIIGRTAMLRCDTWTGSLVPRAGTLYPRKKFAVAVVEGKILVAGGCGRSSAVEEYDPDANSWRVVSESPRRRYGCIGASADGVFYIIGGLKIGQSGDDDQSCAAARAYASSMDLYDVASKLWLRSRAVPAGGCVVAACAANESVYILSSHAVELSFWKFNASRRSDGFGEWRRIRSPPVLAQVRLDGKVRFSCVGFGDKVVLVQVVGCIDDLLRRSGRTERGRKERLVLVYDGADDEWSRAADMAELIRRAAVVCVKC
ncbi:F-box/kelch-repeat protein At5g26960 [Andrographis paniculata]|uniref:F-box/kelch-repeat protein At5g26960 n=1 Tax=Andrographis paniculata TaxID=175694 RepID=UPI0021E724B2|nr:F-box/kelch-repeat protein At5g26960 [Andrographis paniculata]